jgi:hypothetical protein
MKTYILRRPKTVESQKPARPSRRKTAIGTTATVVLGRPPAPTHDRVLFTGFDVHTDSIAVSLAPSDSTEVRRYGISADFTDFTGWFNNGLNWRSARSRLNQAHILSALRSIQSFGG